MTRVGVVTDSSSQLSADRAAAHGIQIVPMGIVISGEEHDEPDLHPDEFYARLRAGDPVRTSLPSPGRLTHAYRESARQGAPAILSVHLDARVSGTVLAARVAATDAPVPVTVVDTRTVSFGVGICAVRAAREAAAGRPSDEIERILASLVGSIGNLFVAPRAPAGRVVARAGWSLLSFNDGATRVVESCADIGQAVRVMVDEIARQGRVGVAVGYADRTFERDADDLEGLVRELPNVTDVCRYRVSPSVGAHTGPDTLGLFWWPA